MTNFNHVVEAAPHRRRVHSVGPFHDAITDLRINYNQLPEAGRFVVGTAVGYFGSRVAVGSATRVVKLAGAIFIAAEALKAAEVLEQNVHVAAVMRRQALHTITAFRKAALDRIDLENGGRQLMKKDRFGTMGVALGAFMGLMR